MLIKELFDPKIIEDDFPGDVELQNALDDIMVQLHQRRMKEVGLDDIAGELSKAVDSIYINPNDPDFRDKLTSSLEKNRWVSQVTPNGMVQIAPSEKTSNGDYGKDAEKDKEVQDRKMQKLGAKSLDRKSKAGEL